MSVLDLRQRDLRQRVFAAIVADQDAGATVAQSRRDVAERFGVPVEVVPEIEREGIEGQWPPL